jgi:hypothetical protein
MWAMAQDSDPSVLPEYLCQTGLVTNGVARLFDLSVPASSHDVEQARPLNAARCRANTLKGTARLKRP